MIGKLIALVAVVASVASADCGYLSTGFTGCESSRVYGSRVLNVGRTFPVVSAVPSCNSPIAVPSQVVDPISPASRVVEPISVVSSPVTRVVEPISVVSSPVTRVVEPVSVVSSPVARVVEPVSFISSPVARVFGSRRYESGIEGSGLYGFGTTGSRLLSSVY